MAVQAAAAKNAAAAAAAQAAARAAAEAAAQQAAQKAAQQAAQQAAQLAPTPPPTPPVSGPFPAELAPALHSVPLPQVDVNGRLAETSMTAPGQARLLPAAAEPPSLDFNNSLADLAGGRTVNDVAASQGTTRAAVLNNLRDGGVGVAEGYASKGLFGSEIVGAKTTIDAGNKGILVQETNTFGTGGQPTSTEIRVTSPNSSGSRTYTEFSNGTASFVRNELAAKGEYESISYDHNTNTGTRTNITPNLGEIQVNSDYYQPGSESDVTDLSTAPYENSLRDAGLLSGTTPKYGAYSDFLRTSANDRMAPQQVVDFARANNITPETLW